MKILKSTLLLFSMSFAQITFAQMNSFYNANQYLQRFDGTFGGNYYCCGSTDNWSLSGSNLYVPFFNISDVEMNNIFGNGTTTGVSDPWAFYITGSSGLGSSNLYGSTTDVFDLTFNTPTPNTYGGPEVAGALANYDSRRSIFIKLLNDPSSNTGFWADAPAVINPTNGMFSLVVTNHSSNSGFVRVEFLTTGAVWGGVASSREFNLPANSTSILAANDLSGNVGAVSLRVSGIVGRLVFDDLAIGLAAPTITGMNLTIGGVVVTSSGIAQGVSGYLDLAVAGADIYKDFKYFNFTVSGAPNVMTVSGDGSFTTSSSNTGVVTVTAISKFDANNRFLKVFTVASPTIAVTNVSISGPNSVTVTGTPTPVTYTATVTPSNATNADLYWSLSGSGASITSTTTSTLTITPNAGGVVTITATSISNPTVTGVLIVTVTPLTSITSVTGITVTGATLLTVGGTASYIATIEPSNATNMSVSWDVMPFGLASISGSGSLVALSPGVVTVTATSVSTPSVSGLLVLEIVTVSGDGGIEPTPISTVPGTTTGLSVKKSVSYVVSPNPATDIVYVSGIDDEISIAVYNSLGVEVLASTVNQVSLATLPKGVYILVIRTASGGVGTTRLIKE